MDWTKCKTGDRNAWIDAAEKLLPFAEAIAYQKCQWLKPEDAEDIAVQAFREIQRQYAAVRSEGDFRARLVACTKYRVLDWIEKTAPSRKHVQNAEDISDPDYKALYYDADPATVFAYENMLREDDRAVAREILNGLDPEVRQLLFDRLVLGMKHREIGEKYGWGTSSVKNRLDSYLKRAKEALSSDPRLKDLPGIDHDEI